MNERIIVNALAKKHAPPSWAFLSQVSNGTAGNKSRTADAIAMSLWPSRGLELHGFEVKVSRSDWKRELDNPAKAEAVCQYCDRWWVVVGDKSIVADGELPPTWGLLAWNDGDLATVVKAPAIATPREITRVFLAAILRRVFEQSPSTEALQAARDDGFKAGQKTGETNRGWELKRLQDREAAFRKFEEASGLRIDGYTAGKIGEAVKALEQLGNIREWLANAMDGVGNHAKAMMRNLDALSAWEASQRHAQDNAEAHGNEAF